GETRKAMEAAQINPERVDAAVSTLSDEELARLASRADKLDKDFAAGGINDRDLLIILVAIAGLILIIVAVRLYVFPPRHTFSPVFFSLLRHSGPGRVRRVAGGPPR